MRIRTASWTACAAFGLVAAAVATAGNIAQVAPGAATIGTPIVIDGDGFGATRRPVVTLKGDGKPIRLGVVASSDAQITAVVRKGVPGVYDVLVRPAGRGASTLVAAGALELATARVDSVAPADPSPGAEITIKGSLFGSRKGRVGVGGLNAFVVSWTDAEIHAVVPSATPYGTQSLEVRNRLGAAILTDALGVGTPDPVVAEVRARLWVNSFGAVNGGVHVTSKGAGFEVAAARGTPGGVHVIRIDLSNVDASSAPASQVVSPAAVEVTHVPREGTPTTWRAGPGGVSLTLEKLPDGRFQAEFSGPLPRVSGTEDPDPLPVTSGTFLASLP